MDSIISNKKECYICGTTLNLHRHHIYMGCANRKNSEKYGCWCYLCANHHNFTNFSVHMNHELDVKMKKLCQEKFEDIHGHDKFMGVFGKNWL